MSTEAALRRAIRDNPDEDTPRLMYADWLDEHGRTARAEFIRVQIQIARLESLSREAKNAFIPVYARHQELLDDHSAELLGPLAAIRNDAAVEYDRGFVSAVALPVGAFLDHAALVAAQRPRPHVSVRGVVGRLVEFVRNPHTGCVTHLHGYTERFDALPQYPNDADDYDLIDAIERLARLESLDLENCGVNDSHCELAVNFSVPSLRTLDLSNNLVTDAGVLDLLDTDLPQQLTHLVLGGNDITDAGAIALAEQWPAGAGDRLEHLNLRFTPIGQAGQRALLNRFGGRVRLF